MTRGELANKFTELHILDSARKTQQRFLQPLGLWDELHNQTSWMKHSSLSDVSKRIRWIISDNPPNPPVCKVCQKNACSWDGYKFAEWCSVPCKNKDTDVRASISVKNHLNKDSRMAKREATTMKRYGVKHVMQIKSISSIVDKKRRVTIRKRYGKFPGKYWYDRITEKNGGINPYNANGVRVSVGEQDVLDNIIKLGIMPTDIIQSDRTLLKGREIDIYIPSHNIGIEYCGIHWHSEWALSRKNDPQHMYHKMIDTRDRGVDLVTVYDIEWRDRAVQVLGFIQSKLNLNNIHIGARECKVACIATADAREFIDAYHIQPSLINPFSYGLFYEGDLIAVMTFRMHHRNNRQIVLSRFCAKTGMTIAGGASKLFKYAVDNNHWDEVVSWSDNRWSNGNLYRKLGFEKQADLPPDYSYVKHGKLIIAKQACTKAKLGAASGQTEHERALELGLYRIYDCGKIRWVWNRPVSVVND